MVAGCARCIFWLHIAAGCAARAALGAYATPSGDEGGSGQGQPGVVVWCMQPASHERRWEKQHVWCEG